MKTQKKTKLIIVFLLIDQLFEYFIFIILNLILYKNISQVVKSTEDANRTQKAEKNQFEKMQRPQYDRNKKNEILVFY